MNNKQPWSEEEKLVVREHYQNLPTSELQKALPARSPGSIYDMAGRLGLKKSPERLSEMGSDLSGRRSKKKT